MRKAVLAALVALSAVPAPAASAADGGSPPPVIRLTPDQARQVYENFEYLRRCPTVDDPYAIHELGGNNCTGGQSGSPQQYGD